MSNIKCTICVSSLQLHISIDPKFCDWKMFVSSTSYPELYIPSGAMLAFSPSFGIYHSYQKLNCVKFLFDSTLSVVKHLYTIRLCFCCRRDFAAVGILMWIVNKLLKYYCTLWFIVCALWQMILSPSLHLSLSHTLNALRLLSCSNSVYVCTALHDGSQKWQNDKNDSVVNKCYLITVFTPIIHNNALRLHARSVQLIWANTDIYSIRLIRLKHTMMYKSKVWTTCMLSNSVCYHLRF